jgi:4-hydroxybenzoate polyprenyltransferase
MDNRDNRDNRHEGTEARRHEGRGKASRQGVPRAPNPFLPSSSLRAFVPSCLAPFSSLSLFARDIKISHTLFALPFALLSTFLAAGGLPKIGMLILILLCMVTARTVAMAANRLLDAKLDAQNPRTQNRAIPSGRLSRSFVLAALLFCAVAFIAASSLFWVYYNNRLPLIFSVPVLLFLCAYPFLKRFTQLCHYYLGAALALAPIGAWVAIKGELNAPPLWMAAAVLAWTAGFDILYACQDYRSDLESGLFSVPAKLGIPLALWVARFTHLLSAAMLIMLGLQSPLLGPIYFSAVGITIALLIIEHALVRSNDLSKINLAFFTINGLISLLLGTAGIIEILLRR